MNIIRKGAKPFLLVSFLLCMPEERNLWFFLREKHPPLHN